MKVPWCPRCVAEQREPRHEVVYSIETDEFVCPVHGEIEREEYVRKNACVKQALDVYTVS